MDSSNTHNYGYFHSPIGILEIAAQQGYLKHILFVENTDKEEFESTEINAAKQQLAEYFAGTLQHFNLPLSPEGTTFQNKVWQALQTIAYGETCSYLDIATTLGDKNAVRAVGAANGKNPLSIVVPCHRVIGKNGKLTGYAGGLSRKAWLLDLESGQNRHAQSTLF